MRWVCVAGCLLLFLTGNAAAQDAAPIALKDGDRIVFLGDGFFEREYEHGFIESAITLRNARLKLTFRNLGWTGDTVWGDSRAGFEAAKDGFARRAALVKELKPDVILVSYGMNESYAGEAGLEAFVVGLKGMLDSLGESGARVVLVSPTAHENLGPPLPDGVAHNRQIGQYVEAMRSVAAERGLAMVDLFAEHQRDLEAAGSGRWTTDGVHLSEAGYRRFAPVVARALGGTDAVGDSAALRGAIVEKNALLFHRLRPQNETYLYLFRKHEQGHMAGEVPQFDPLIADKEAEIDRLKRGVQQ